MVDKILLSNVGSNCKDQMDTFPLNLRADRNASNLSMAASLTNGHTPKQTQKVIVIMFLRIEDLIQLEHIVGHIKDYIMKKLPPYI